MPSNHDFSVRAQYRKSSRELISAICIHSDNLSLACSALLRKAVKNFSFRQCASLISAEYESIIFTACLSVSFKLLKGLMSNERERLKYFLIPSSSDCWALFLTLSNAHITWRIQWYLSTIFVALLNQLSAILKYGFHISDTKKYTFRRCSFSYFLKYEFKSF